MITYVIVDKYGKLKELKAKELLKEELYKKCGFRKKDGFDKRTTWNVLLNNEKFKIELYAKDNGKANTENKYEFPPPIDTILYFGNCCLINCDLETNKPISLTVKTWMKIYEHLFGGFHDLEDEELSEDELEHISKHLKTKSGYLKDGFVIDSDDIIDNNSNDDDDDINESDEYIDDEYNIHENFDNKKIVEQLEDTDEEDNNIGSELSEEDYEYSDDEK